MGISCCGKDRSTPFCPTCGSALQAPAILSGLLAHIRARIKTLEHQATKIEAWPEDVRVRRTSYISRLLQSSAKAKVKWRAWERGLLELMKTEETDEDGT